MKLSDRVDGGLTLYCSRSVLGVSDSLFIRQPQLSDPLAVGNDIRKVVDDGYPVQNIVVSDINPRMFELNLIHATTQ
jgi:hypothetical protein